MPTNPGVSEVVDKNGVICDIEAKRFDGNRTVKLTGDVTGQQSWGGGPDADSSTPSLSVSTSITDEAITTSKIKPGAVINDRIADSTIEHGKLNIASVANTNGSGITDGNNDKLATHGQVKTYVEALVSGRPDYKGMQTPTEINSWSSVNLNNGDRVIVTGIPDVSGQSGTAVINDGMSEGTHQQITVTNGVELIYYKTTVNGTEVHGWQSKQGEFKLAQNPVDTDNYPAGTGGGVSKTLTRLRQNDNGDITPTFGDISIASSQVNDKMSTYDGTGSNKTKLVTGEAVKAAIDSVNYSGAGGNGKIITAVSQANGVVAATEQTMDSVPTQGHTNTTVTSDGIKAAIDAIDPGSTGMGEVVAAALDDLDARLRANEDAVSETNLGTRSADRIDVQTLVVAGSDITTDLSNKVDKVAGKGLSTNDFTDTYKSSVDANTTARHTHTNKTVLDGITSTDVSNWNAKQSALTWMTNEEVHALWANAKAAALAQA